MLYSEFRFGLSTLMFHYKQSCNPYIRGRVENVLKYSSVCWIINGRDKYVIQICDETCG